MGDDHAAEAQRAEHAGASAIQRGEAAQHAHVFQQHVEHGDEEHRRQRSDDADALGGLENGAPRLAIEGSHQLALGQCHQRAGIVDVLLVLDESAGAPAHVGAAIVERAHALDGGELRLGIGGGDGRDHVALEVGEA